MNMFKAEGPDRDRHDIVHLFVGLQEVVQDVTRRVPVAAGT